ncbi:hypothetical protein BGAL_0020g00460 [Botrytis galanthina]|uniref:Uncharacterized protein n=1 Tax=Botrytis galanthina TaxID=278940 RepID=A0A4S8RC60_9HELO|nr:hypothetical protein BGAL_0020g00460 [Botrytis galanthina]
MSNHSSTSSYRDPRDWALVNRPKAHSKASSARTHDTDFTVREGGSLHGRSSEHGRSSIFSRDGESRGGRSDRARSIASNISDSAYSEVTVTTARERGKNPKEKKYRFPERDLRPDNGYQQLPRQSQSQPYATQEIVPPGTLIRQPTQELPSRRLTQYDDDDGSDADTVRPEDSASQVSTQMSSKKGGSRKGRSSNGRSSNGRSSNDRRVDRYERSPERHIRPHGLAPIKEGYIYQKTTTVTKEVEYGWKRQSVNQ